MIRQPLWIIVFISLPGWAQQSSSKPATAEVQADHLEVQHKNKLAKFKGNVRATYGPLTLSCDQMTVRYSDGGKVSAMNATGGVVVKRGDARAEAEAAALDAVKHRLVLTGKPVLFQGPHRLSGARIAIHLTTGRVDVKQAVGSFRFVESSPK